MDVFIILDAGFRTLHMHKSFRQISYIPTQIARNPCVYAEFDNVGRAENHT